MDKMKILVMADWYEPGYKAGGPVRSCVNFVRQMRGNYEVYVFTSDRDLGSASPYEGIRTDEWYNAAGVWLYYCSPLNLTWQNIKRQMIWVQPGFLYLNSMFSPKFTIYPVLISRMNRLAGTIVLAPRGMLRASALRFKPLKKQIFLRGFRWLGLQRKIRFHASDETESNDVHRHFGEQAMVTRIPNYPGAFSGASEDAAVAANPGNAVQKRPGDLTMIFIGRVHPIKNLDYLLRVLKDVRSRVRLTIIGSVEDRLFWEKCMEMISDLPANIQVEYKGEKPNHELPEIIAGHHIFALPTRGENFGHAIFEALTLGKIVLISDQTPWKELQRAKAGWDLPLNRPELFLQAIEQAAGFDQEEYNAWRSGALRYVREYIDGLNIKEEYLKLFS
jgi:glycosyltransferase involved in cell wall biosynthesis